VLNTALSLFLLGLFVTLFLSGCASKSVLNERGLGIESVLTVDENSTVKINAGKLHVQTQIENKTPEQVLVDFLLTSNEKQLLSDNRFESISQVASNNEEDISTNFAIAFAKYLVDENYSCTKPIYNQYFNTRFNGIDSIACEESVPFNVVSKYGFESVRWLDPKRVSAIHVLFAGNDDRLMSRFGHVSLRLIVCPENNDSLEACDSNLYEHIVLGYRAQVDELKINYLKGLMGDYQSYFFAYDFMDTYQEYSIGEFRDLFSLPLNLTSKQRESMVRAMSEIHWTYSGEYKFLTKNCSTLLQHALEVTWTDYLNEPELHELYWRPDNFFSAIRNTTLSDASKLGELKKAEEEGYYFPSTEPVYQKAFKVVYAAMQEPSFKNLDDYLDQNPVIRYQNALQDKSYYDMLSKDEYLLNAQLLIEELSSIQLGSRLMAETSYYFDNNDMAIIKTHMDRELSKEELNVFSKCIFEPIIALKKPKKRSSGIPMSSSHQVNEDSLSICESLESVMKLKLIAGELEKIDPDSWRPIKVASLFRTENIRNIQKYSDLKTIVRAGN